MNKLIQLKNLTKNFDDQQVLRGINLDIYENEFLTLLGPSGCGKTTTLRIIAGFEEPSGGEVLFNGIEISKLPPYKREVNTVFQKYALFPHLNVAENIAFGLNLKKVEKSVIDQKVGKMLKMVGLEGFEKRDDFDVLEAKTTSEAKDIMVKSFLEAADKYGLDNVVCLTPYRRKGDACAIKLNSILQALINPPKNGSLCVTYTTEEEDGYRYEQKLRVGDPVMQLVNAEKVANGDIGTVCEIDKEHSADESDCTEHSDRREILDGILAVDFQCVVGDRVGNRDCGHVECDTESVEDVEEAESEIGCLYICSVHEGDVIHRIESGSNHEYSCKSLA